MKKSILNLGTTLNRNEQKEINGGIGPIGLGEGKCPTNPRLCVTGNGFCIPCHL